MRPVYILKESSNMGSFFWSGDNDDGEYSGGVGLIALISRITSDESRPEFLPFFAGCNSGSSLPSQAADLHRYFRVGSDIKKPVGRHRTSSLGGDDAGVSIVHQIQQWEGTSPLGPPATGAEEKEADISSSGHELPIEQLVQCPVEPADDVTHPESGTFCGCQPGAPWV